MATESVLGQFGWEKREITSSTLKKIKFSKSRVCRNANKNRRSLSLFGSKAIDFTQLLADEIWVKIFGYLPRMCLLNVSLVCQRWNQISSDRILWRGIDMSKNVVLFNDITNALKRGTLALKMVETKVKIKKNNLKDEFLPPIRYPLRLLDMTMCSISPEAMLLLLSRCRSLEKLSLESCAINDDICKEIAENKNLKVLNTSMCTGVNVVLLSQLTRLEELNISWVKMDEVDITYLVSNLPLTLKRLNISRGRPSITDKDVLIICFNCPDLVELNISNNTRVTDQSIEVIANNLPKLEKLSISRCFEISLLKLKQLLDLKSFRTLNIHRTFKENRMVKLIEMLDGIQLNKSYFSTVARPFAAGGDNRMWGSTLSKW